MERAINARVSSDRRSCWRARKSVAAAVLGEPQPFREGWSVERCGSLLPTSYFPIGCGSEPPLGFRSPLFLDAIREIDRLATNFLILNSSSDLLTGSPESEWK